MSVFGTLKNLLKSLLSHTRWRIVGSAVNRFDATDHILGRLQRNGFDPTIVIDGGAHLGEFSLAASPLFLRAAFHLVEPQRACHPSLAALCARTGFVLHGFALSDRIGDTEFAQTSEPSTGALVWTAGGIDTVTVETSTLDAMFGHILALSQRPLLKLDLQGHELKALQGGVAVLRSVEVIFIEVSFYTLPPAPTFFELMVFLDAHGFTLYDIAMLAGRARDDRLRQGDVVFVRRDSPLVSDDRWA